MFNSSHDAIFAPRAINKLEMYRDHDVSSAPNTQDLDLDFVSVLISTQHSVSCVPDLDFVSVPISMRHRLSVSRVLDHILCILDVGKIFYISPSVILFFLLLSTMLTSRQSPNLGDILRELENVSSHRVLHFPICFHRLNSPFYHSLATLSYLIYPLSVMGGSTQWTAVLSCHQQDNATIYKNGEVRSSTPICIRVISYSNLSS